MLWWHWVVLGITLILLELVVQSFFFIWIGLSAGIVGALLFVYPVMPAGFQIVAWTIGSLLLVWLWFKVFKPNMFKSRVGLSKGSLIGEIGLVTREIRPYGKGQIRFQKPILGEDVWESRAEEEIRVGERVKVADVEGNTLIVIKI